MHDATPPAPTAADLLAQAADAWLAEHPTDLALERAHEMRRQGIDHVSWSDPMALDWHGVTHAALSAAVLRLGPGE